MQTFEILVFPEIKIKFESCKRNVLKEVHLTNYLPTLHEHCVRKFEKF